MSDKNNTEETLTETLDRVLDEAIDSPDYDKILKEIEAQQLEANETIEKTVTDTKISIIREYPFLGFIMMSTKLVFTYSIQTCAATVSRGNPTVMFNPIFYQKVLINDKERGFVFLHEILHIYLDHLGRRRERNYHGRLWNVATDYVINYFLTQMGGTAIERPEMGLYDERFAGMSADEVYHILLEENDGDPEKAAEAHGAGSGGDEEVEGQRPFDKVSDEEVSEATQNANKQRISASMANGEDARTTSYGNGTCDLVRMFGEMLTPVIPWTELLEQEIVSSNSGIETYNRIDRKSKTVIFPTYDGDHCSLIGWIDSSGSMGPSELSSAMTEIGSIMEMFDTWEMTVGTCDTQAYPIGHYSSDEGDDLSSIGELIGGGGTDMQPMIDYTAEMDDPPSMGVIFTDGHIPKVVNDSDIPFVMIITPNGNKDMDNLVEGNIKVIHMNDES